MSSGLPEPIFQPWMAIAGMIALTAGIVGYAIWDRETCAEWGPTRIGYQTVSCGKGCYSTYPVEYRDCVRRKGE